MSRIGLLLFFILPFSLKAQTGIITTVAGNGMPGYGLTGVPAMSTAAGPGLQGLAIDDTGNYYFTVGEDDQRIRKVTTSGLIYTIAGIGTPGYSGDSGLATAAEIDDPVYLAFDKDGNLYFSDLLNNRIRKINMATGIIYTFAGNGTAGYSDDGGPAIAAEINEPTGICFDTIGNLYIADGNNYRIRKVDTAGIIHPFAGNGINDYSNNSVFADSTSMDFLEGLCFDAYGNLYVSETNVIYKIDTVGIIHRIAGNDTGAANTGNEGPADFASIGAMQCIAMNREGQLFLSDASGNSVIRMIDTTGIIHHIAGTGIEGYNGDGIDANIAELSEPRGIAFDTCGNLYLCDNGNFRVRKITFNPYCWPEKVNKVVPLKINIYPNPAYDLLNIDNITKQTTYSLLNLVGITLQPGILQPGNNSISVQSLPAGLYLLKLMDNKGLKSVTKIIKQ